MSTSPTAAGPTDRRHARALTREVLSSGRVRTFLGLQGVGQMADAMTTLVLAQVVVFELERGATPGAVGRTLLVATLPWLAAGPLAGFATDRFDRRSVLAVSAAGRAVVAIVAIAVPETGSRALGYGAAAVLLALGATSFVVRGASWPHLVDDDRLVVANSLSSITSKVSGSCGFVVAALIGTEQPVVVLTAACTLQAVGAIGFAAGRTSYGGGDRPTTVRVSRTESLRQLHVIARRPPMRSAIVSSIAQRALYGAAFVAFVLLVDRRYDLDAPGYAAAIGSTATGAFAGTVVAPVLSLRLGSRRLVTVAFAATGVAMAIAAVSAASAAVLVAMIVASCSFQVVRLVADAVVQHHVGDEVLGRIYAGFDTAYNAAYLLGATTVVLVGSGHPFAVFGAVAAVHAAVAVVRFARSARAGGAEIAAPPVRRARSGRTTPSAHTREGDPR